MSRIHDALKKAEQDRAAEASEAAVAVQTLPPLEPAAPAPAQTSYLAPVPPPLQHPIFAPDPLAAPAPPQMRIHVPVPEPEIKHEPEIRAVWETRAEPEFKTAIATETIPAAPPAPVPDVLTFDDLATHCAHPEWRMDPNMNVFLNEDAGHHGSEQFRNLRSRLFELRSKTGIKILLVTSSTVEEGKTFVSSNLAQSIIRQPDQRVLLIDGDLRRPRLHIPLGAPISPGLTDFLRGEADEYSIIQRGDAGNLCLIPCGNEITNPSELISNGRLPALLQKLAPAFDWIIMDSPPCLPVADTRILADFCDGILMVVRAGSTPAETAQRGCRELQGKKIIGVVLNAVTDSELYDSYYYGGYNKESA